MVPASVRAAIRAVRNDRLRVVRSPLVARTSYAVSLFAEGCCETAPPGAKARSVAGVGRAIGRWLLWPVGYLQQALSVPVQQLLLVFGAKRQGFRPFGSRRIIDERIVDREQDAVDPHLHHAAQ